MVSSCFVHVQLSQHDMPAKQLFDLASEPRRKVFWGLWMILGVGFSRRPHGP